VSWRWLGLLAVLLAGCPKRERQPGQGAQPGDPPPGRPPIDGGFAVTGHGAGARPSILAGPPIDAAVDAAAMLGGLLAVPECAAFVRMMEHCLPQLQPPVVDSFRQSIKAMREQSFAMGELPVETVKLLSDSCKQSGDSLRQSLAILGCVVPP
jgi:hypothetical protein